MESMKIYEDIAHRTGGNIYIGVVGPVRTGKSTFIKRFMEAMVIPNIENAFWRERAKDELPQSGSGRTIMTSEPKFIPEEAVAISIGPAHMNVRLIDSVGYMVKGALGQLENDMPRMVTTPWFDHEVTLTQAAETGTRKVIAEHSTIGLVITTDGSITEIPREDYLEAENRVITELKAISKPFVVLVNSTAPDSEVALSVCSEISQKHGVTCLAVNCASLDEDEVSDILRSVLYEFPLRELSVFLPDWVDALPTEHALKTAIYGSVLAATQNLTRILDIDDRIKQMNSGEYISSAALETLDLGQGLATARLDAPRSLFYQTLSENTGFNIKGDGDLITLLSDLADSKRSYDKVAGALEQVKATGYGIVVPSIDELRLEQPEIVRHGGRYGVRMRASAPSIHMIRADIETEVSPIVGSEKQSEELVHFLLKEFEDDTGKLWNSNIFGKSLHELVNEGLYNKLNRMPEDARYKLQETLQRIINEGSGGLICIIL